MWLMWPSKGTLKYGHMTDDHLIQGQSIWNAIWMEMKINVT